MRESSQDCYIARIVRLRGPGETTGTFGSPSEGIASEGMRALGWKTKEGLTMRTLSVPAIAIAMLMTARGATAAPCSDAAAVATARASAEAACEAEGRGCTSAPNHGQYVSCISQQLNQNATLPKECRGAAKKCAAKSTCGKPGFVTCCRTKPRSDGTTATKCSIKRDADHCTAPKGGTACAGAQSSCCDACLTGDCGGGSASGAFFE